MADVLTKRELRDWVDSLPVAGSLTAFTGRRRMEEATTYIGRTEVSQTKAIVAVVAGVFVGFPLAGTLIWVFAALGIVNQSWWLLPVPVVVAFAGVTLFTTRERRGLQLLRYQAILDRRRAAKSRGRVHVGLAALTPAYVGELVPITIDTPERFLPGAPEAVIPGSAPRRRLLEAVASALGGMLRRPTDPEPQPTTAWDEAIPARDAAAAEHDVWSTTTRKDSTS